MKSVCPYAHVSYATWRLQILRQLYNITEVGHKSQTLALYLQPRSPKVDTTRNFHTSPTRPRGNVKDVKRSARFKVKKQNAVQLELDKYVEPDFENATPDAEATSQGRQDRQHGDKWHPFAKSSQQEMEDLVKNLQTMAKQAASKHENEERIPFERGSRIYDYKQSNKPESPLERRLPWDIPKKLQTPEMEVDKRLENNPWAQMLASDLRLDRGTKARIPRDLMLSFGVVQNPKDEKPYFMPVELSDFEALHKELNWKDASPKSQEQSGNVDGTDETWPNRPRPGTRVNIAASKLIYQAMSADFMTERSGRKQQITYASNSAKISTNLIPFRWRHKQEEMKAFQQTRERFNTALNREPDADEPDMTSMVDLQKLQWQHDIAERIEKIMQKRVLLTLAAVGRDNASGRAIHDRRILALPVPGSGQVYFDERGRISSNHSSTSTDEQPSTTQELSNDKVPGWIHGAVCLHVGSPEIYRSTIETWQSQFPTQPSNPSHLIPPMLTISNQFRLPVFNLETLIGQNQATQVQELINAHKIFDVDFWTQKAGDFTTDASSTRSDSEITTSASPLDAGDRVLSSIITPGASTSVKAESDSGLDLNAGAGRNGKCHKIEKSYLILVKSRAQHCKVLVRELWALWRYIGGRKGLYY